MAAQAAAAARRTPKALAGRHSRPPPTGREPRGRGGRGGGCPPGRSRSGRGGFEGSHFLSPHHTTQLSQHAVSVQIRMSMCAMALRLVLVFRPVSPLSGHSHAAGRRGRPTLSPGLGPVRHTSLELEVKNYSPYLGPDLCWSIWTWQTFYAHLCVNHKLKQRAVASTVYRAPCHDVDGQTHSRSCVLE